MRRKPTDFGVPRFRRHRDDESGNLILLAGIVLAIALVATSIGLTEINNLSQGAGATRAATFVEEWRFIRERTPEVFASAMTLTSDEASAKEVFNATAGEITNLQEGRGFELVARVANSQAPTSEYDYLNGDLRYDDIVTVDGVQLSGPYDGVNDGYIWTDGGSGYLQAIVVYYFFSDSNTDLSEVTVFAVNSGGSGTPSAPRKFSAVGSIPQGGTVGYGEAATVALSWLAPDSPGGGPIRSYELLRDGVAIASVVSGEFTYTDSTALQGVEYTYAARGLNAYGTGASATATIVAGEAPSAPANLQATAGAGSITLTWTAPFEGSAPIGGYLIYRGSTASNVQALAPASSGATSYVDSSIQTGTWYYYAVSAYSTAGEGAKATVGPVLAIGAPTAPLNMYAQPGDDSATLSWSEPANDGGSPLTSYVLRRGVAADNLFVLATLTSATTSYLDTTASNYVTYYYNVTAHNAAGAGPASTKVSVTPQPPPSYPRALIATPGDGQITLDWNKPSPENPPILTYRVYNATSGTPVFLADVGTGLSTVISGLQNGYAYTYVMTAVNSVGEGAQSSPANATPTGPPGAPLSLAATPGSAQTSLTWAAPTSNGGSTITAYTIYAGASNPPTGVLTTVGGTTYSYTHSPIIPGVTYYYLVTATNAYGEGASSSVASATGGTVPSAPLALTATPGSGSVALDWTAPASNGFYSITNYKIYRGTTSGTHSLLTTSDASLAYVDTTAVTGTTYYYVVTAVNAIGESPKSTEAASAAASAPSAPLTLTATPGSSIINLGWAAPASDGGSAITTYRVYGGTTANPTTLVGATIPSTRAWTQATVPGLTWYFRVTAVNAIGESTYSNEVSASATL